MCTSVLDEFFGSVPDLNPQKTKIASLGGGILGFLLPGSGALSFPRIRNLLLIPIPKQFVYRYSTFLFSKN
jgi:hypothetical protein